ncbi:hypothetical protein KIN20_009485 [Parelaphostrongylus tenuis]|uniref:Uncharacterized protein n=1 Tax=Parelaphostrongylus tenuis TaxID=148309 RepID=A0AAD5M6F4_PARTN|nr:hypothetical protein KIN20_009485 [Parelaphostrongylus tenuis]
MQPVARFGEKSTDVKEKSALYRVSYSMFLNLSEQKFVTALSFTREHVAVTQQLLVWLDHCSQSDICCICRQHSL